MNEYEVLIETINPCGGEAHSKKEFLEVEAASPEAYVAQNAHFSDVEKEFAEVQRLTSCSTGCGGCHDKIMAVISERLSG